MSFFSHHAMAAVIGASLATLCLPAAHASASNDELLKLLQEQSAQIELLKQRLQLLEAQGTAAAQSPPAPRQDTRQAAANGDGIAGTDVNWDRGAPAMRSDDGFFTFRPSGRVVTDFSRTQGSAYADRNNSGTEMRGLRLGAEGSLGRMIYKIDVDFTDQAASVKNAWVGYNFRALDVPMELYVGNMLKERGIDAATLSRNPLIERNAAAAIGAPVNSSYGVGGFLKTYGSSWHLAMSITGDDLDRNATNSTDSDSIAYGIRGHWNPVKGSQGFVHIGSSYFYESLAGDVPSISTAQRVGSNFNDHLRVSSGTIADPTKGQSYGLELGGVYRSFWLFGEYAQRRVDARNIDRTDHEGMSIAAGWLITGEKPGFSTRTGIWSGTRPLNPIGNGGWGAFELVARHDVFDYRDAPLGGYARRMTAGVNWELNTWSRLMLHYVDWITNNQVGAWQGYDAGNSINVRAQLLF